jgi:predicted small secreted protein
MKLRTTLLHGLLATVALLLSACANTDTPVSRAIGAQMQARAMMPMGASSAPQRTGMQDFFARGGVQ